MLCNCVLASDLIVVTSSFLILIIVLVETLEVNTFSVEPNQTSRSNTRRRSFKPEKDYRISPRIEHYESHLYDY